MTLFDIKELGRLGQGRLSPPKAMMHSTLFQIPPISEHLSESIYNFPLCFGRSYIFPLYFGNTFLFPLFLKFPPIFVPFMCFFIINEFLASPYFHHDAFYSSCNTRTGP